MSDNAIEIRITGAVDPSLRSSALSAGGQLASGLKTAESATHDLHFATVGAIEDYFHLGQAVASGNLSSLGNTLLSLGKESGVFDAALATMGTEATIATGGLALLAGGLGYLAYQAIAAQEAVEKISLTAAFAGNNISTKELDAYITDLEEATNVSQDDAELIANAFLRIKDMTKDGAEAAGREVSAYAQLTGQTIPEATKILAKSFSDPIANVKSFVESLNDASIEQILAADAASRSGNRYQALAVMLQTLSAAEHTHARALAEQNSGAFSSFSNFMTYFTAGQMAARGVDGLASSTQNAIAVQNAHNEVVARNTKEFDKNADAIDKAADALKNYLATPQGKLELGLAAGDAEDPLGAQFAATNEHIKQITAAIDVLNSHSGKAGDALKASLAKAGIDLATASVGDLTRQLGVAKDKARQLQNEMALQENPGLALWEKQEETKTASAKRGSADRISVAREERDEIAKLLKAKGLDPKNAEQFLTAQAKLDDEVRASKEQSVKAASAAEKTGAEEAISAARDASQEILSNDRLTASERGAIAKQLWDLLSNGNKLNADQRAQAATALAQRIAREEGLSADEQKDVEAQISSILVGSAQLTAQQRSDAVRDGARAESEARHQAAREAEKIEKDAAQSKIDAAKNAFEETSTLLEAESARFGLTEGEKIGALRAATNSEIDAQIKVLAEEQKHYEEGVDAYRDYQKKIDDLRAQQHLKMLQYDTDEAKAAVKTWQSIISPIESGMSSMVSSLISGQTKFGAATRQLLVQVVSDWVGARIKIEFDWLAGRLAMELGDQKWANKGILEAIFGANTEVAVQKQAEAEKTATTAAGTASRDALGETENSGFLGRIVDQIAQWLGLETSKTAETATGTAARITASGAETAATIAAAKAQAAGEIPAYTGIAAMEAASAVADIPIIGPGLALAAAEAMNTQGATELSIATAEGGMESVDAAEQAVLVHRKESILPARISVPLMSFVSDLPAMAERVKQNSAPDLRSIADVGSLIPVMSPGASVRAAQRTQAPQSDADYVASRVGGGRASASPTPAPSKTRGGDIHIHAWDASSMNQFFRKPANRRTMDQISKDRVRAGFLPG